MLYFDIIIILLLLLCFFRGLKKGFFKEIASLTALIGGIYGAIHFYYFIANLFKNIVPLNEGSISLIAFAITFILIIILISLLGKILTRIANFASLGFINKLLGGFLGVLKISFILSVIFIFFDRFNQTIPLIKKEKFNNSIMFKPIKKIAPFLFPSISENKKN